MCLVPAAATAATSLPSTSTSAGSPVAPAGSTPAKVVTKPTSTTTVVLSSTQATLRRGDRGTAVRNLQLKLRAHRLHYVVADGDFGPLTQKAVKVMQGRYHMAKTGVATVPFLRKLGLEVVVTAAIHVEADVAAPAATKYLRVFPIAGNAAHPYSTKLYPYTDVFGQPGPLSSPTESVPYEGAELPAAAGTPVVAVCNLTVVNLNREGDGVDGIWIQLQDITGTQYYYEQLDSVASGLTAGSSVKTGQEIGTVGDTGVGDAIGPSLYLQVNPGGGAAIDPYSDLNVLEPTVKTS